MGAISEIISCLMGRERRMFGLLDQLNAEWGRGSDVHLSHYST